VFSLHSFVSTFNLCLKKIQGLTTLLCEQKHRIDELSKTLIEEGYLDGPFDVFDENNAECVICGKFRVTYESAKKFIQDQGPFVNSLLAKLEAEDHQSYVDAVKSIALLFANSVDGLSAIVAERNARNEPTDTLPPVLPHDLLLLRPHDFGQLLQLHDRRLKVSYTEAEIEGNHFKVQSRPIKAGDPYVIAFRSCACSLVVWLQFFLERAPLNLISLSSVVKKMCTEQV
jgi:hypothetical protein